MKTSEMKFRTRFLSLVSCACLSAFGAKGDETSVYTWSGGSGEWTTSSQWKDASGTALTSGYPNDAGAKVVFPNTGSPYKVRLAESVDVWRVAVESGADVTFSGGGTVTTWTTGWNENVFNVFNGRVTFESFVFKMKGCLTIRADLTLNDNSHIYTPNDVHLGETGVRLVVNGGSHYIRHLYLEAPAPGAALIVNGGKLGVDTPKEYTLTFDIYTGGDLYTVSKVTPAYAGNKVEVYGGAMNVWTAVGSNTEWRVISGTAGFNGVKNCGGVIRVAESAAVAYLANDLGYWDPTVFDFAKGSTLSWQGSAKIPESVFKLPCVVAYNGTSAYSPLEAADDTYRLAGSFVATNGANAGLAIAAQRGAIRGKGSAVVSRLTQTVGEGYFSLTNIVIGNRLDIIDGADTYFRTPVTIGSFGDWTTTYTSWGSTCLHFLDDVTVNTRDVFDQSTTHSVQLLNVQPEPGVAFSATGGGTVVYSTYNNGFSGGINYKKLRPWRQVTVGAGTTLEIMNGKALLCDKLVMEANAKIKFNAGKSVVEARETEIDPAASFDISVSSENVTIDTPLLNGDFKNVASSALVLSGLATVSHTLNFANGCYYLDDGVEPDHPPVTSGIDKPAYWTAKADNGIWNDGNNWSNGNVPYNWNPWEYGERSRYAAFDGFRSLNVTFGGHQESWQTTHFLPTSGPFVIDTDSGCALSSWNLLTGDTAAKQLTSTNASIGTCSVFPIRIRGKIVYYSEWSAYVADTPSFLELAGGLTCPANKTGQLAVGGDVHMGGTNVMDTMEFVWSTLKNAKARETRLMLLPDSELVLRHHAANWGEWFSGQFQRGMLDVRERARLIFGEDGLFRFTTDRFNQCNYVSGEIDVLCPYLVSTKVCFFGPGHVKVSGTIGMNASCRGETIIGRGLTFSADGWDTAFDGTSGYENFAQGITVDGGVAYLAAEKNWTYGMRAGCQTTTTVDQRALKIAADSELVIASTNAVISFADPIRGEGKLTFAPGARIALAGALADAADSGAWTELATVESWSGMPILPSAYSLREVPAEDGLVTLQCKRRHGLALIVR